MQRRRGALAVGRRGSAVKPSCVGRVRRRAVASWRACCRAERRNGGAGGGGHARLKAADVSRVGDDAVAQRCAYTPAHATCTASDKEPFQNFKPWDGGDGGAMAAAWAWQPRWLFFKFKTSNCGRPAFMDHVDQITASRVRRLP